MSGGPTPVPSSVEPRRGGARTIPEAWRRRGGVFLWTALVVVGLAAAGLIAYLVGLTPNAGAGAFDGASALAPTSGLDGSVSYVEPATTNDPAAPGLWLSVGSDETDPFMVVENGTYYLFTSRADNGGANVPVRAATVPGRWGPVVDALPTLPAWAEPGWAWAPDLQRFGTRYVLYFTTLLRGSSPATMCIGAAVGSAVTGPFVPQPQPFICQRALGGSIDPRTFVAPDGRAYMLWKSDQNAVSTATPTQIYSQPLGSDGLSLVGRPSVIFAPDEPWQGTIVEAPQMWEEGGVFYLFYSGGWFNQAGYAIGVARCAGPRGPCADASPTPLLASNTQGAGPGEESVFADAKGIWLLYAPFHSSVPYLGPPRPAPAARLGFDSAGV
jgi:hypothetical protein